MNETFLRNTKFLFLMSMFFVQIRSYSQSKIEFPKDKTAYYKTQTENINGCKKVISWKAYDAKTKKIKNEWIKDFAKDSNQTCDFSAYIIYKKKYRKGKLIELKQYYAGSQESEEQPCGLWEFYNSNGKLYKNVKYDKCDIAKYGAQ